MFINSLKSKNKSQQKKSIKNPSKSNCYAANPSKLHEKSRKKVKFSEINWLSTTFNLQFSKHLQLISQMLQNMQKIVPKKGRFFSSEHQKKIKVKCASDLLTGFVGISIEIVFHGWGGAGVLLMPDGAASLLLRMCHKWCVHLREAVITDVSRFSIVEWLLVMMVGLLGHHVMLLVCYLDRLRWIIAVEVISIRWHVLWMRYKLMMLMEGRELHRRLSRHFTAAKGWWWMSEGQWGRFWTLTQFARDVGRLEF